MITIGYFLDDVFKLGDALGEGRCRHSGTTLIWIHSRPPTVGEKAIAQAEARARGLTVTKHTHNAQDTPAT
jgi:hypothetical protein